MERPNFKQIACNIGFDLLPHGMEIIFLENTLRDIAAHIANGQPVVLASNHQSHVDIVPFAYMASKIIPLANQMIASGEYPQRHPFQDFWFPVANSVQTGGQSAEVTGIYKVLNPWLQKKGIRAIPINRKRDFEHYGEKGLPSTYRSDREILTVFDGDHADGHYIAHGLALPISGSVEEGRHVDHDPKKRLIGMVPINDKNSMTRLIIKEHAKGHNVMIVPLAFNGTYRLFNPDARKITAESFKALLDNINPFIFTKPIWTWVLEPMMSDNLFLDAPEKESDQHAYLNNVILAEIARHLPPAMRGEFQSST